MALAVVINNTMEPNVKNNYFLKLSSDQGNMQANA